MRRRLVSSLLNPTSSIFRLNRSTILSPYRSKMYISQQTAIDVDVELLAVFETAQLMELAGLSVAQCVMHHLTTPTQRNSSFDFSKTKFVVLCGSGNNGGDGLVAARHLTHFGCTNITVVYPKLQQLEKPLYKALLQQLRWCSGVNIVDKLDPTSMLHSSEECVVVLDAVFGYSFQGSIREPYRTILQQVRQWHEEQKTDKQQRVLVSVDVPSGWDVEKGPRRAEEGYEGAEQGLGSPDVLVSLMLPKLGVQSFQGRHYIGGRFVPQAIAEKYQLEIPTFEGTSQFIDITHHTPLASSL